MAIARGGARLNVNFPKIALCRDDADDDDGPASGWRNSPGPALRNVVFRAEIRMILQSWMLIVDAVARFTVFPTPGVGFSLLRRLVTSLCQIRNTCYGYQILRRYRLMLR